MVKTERILVCFGPLQGPHPFQAGRNQRGGPMGSHLTRVWAFAFALPLHLPCLCLCLCLAFAFAFALPCLALPSPGWGVCHTPFAPHRQGRGYPFVQVTSSLPHTVCTTWAQGICEGSSPLRPSLVHHFLGRAPQSKVCQKAAFSATVFWKSLWLFWLDFVQGSASNTCFLDEKTQRSTFAQTHPF